MYSLLKYIREDTEILRNPGSPSEVFMTAKLWKINESTRKNTYRSGALISKMM